MQEIFMNGPVAVSWNPPDGFSSYRSGVIKEVGELKKNEDYNYPTHSTMIIGWKTTKDG